MYYVCLSVIFHQNLLKNTGAQGKTTVFLITDTQIKEESFLEDIDNLLNTGEVPNLFATDEKAEIMEVRVLFTCTCVHSLTWAFTHVHMRMHACMHAHARIQCVTHMQTHTHVHAHMHAHTHAHTHAFSHKVAVFWSSELI